MHLMLFSPAKGCVMTVRKVSRVSRKNLYGDSDRTMGLIIPIHGGTGSDCKKVGFKVNTIGRVLFPVSEPRAKAQKLSVAVRSVVADLKK